MRASSCSVTPKRRFGENNDFNTQVLARASNDADEASAEAGSECALEGSPELRPPDVEIAGRRSATCGRSDTRSQGDRLAGGGSGVWGCRVSPAMRGTSHAAQVWHQFMFRKVPHVSGGPFCKAERGGCRSREVSALGSRRVRMSGRRGNRSICPTGRYGAGARSVGMSFL